MGGAAEHALVSIHLPIRMQSLTTFLALLATGPFVMPVRAAPGESSIQTRYSPVVAYRTDTADDEYSDVRVSGKSVARIESNASLYKLSLPHKSEFLLVDTLTPGLNCQHVLV